MRYSYLSIPIVLESLMYFISFYILKKNLCLLGVRLVNLLRKYLFLSYFYFYCKFFLYLLTTISFDPVRPLIYTIC